VRVEVPLPVEHLPALKAGEKFPSYSMRVPDVILHV